MPEAGTATPPNVAVKEPEPEVAVLKSPAEVVAVTVVQPVLLVAEPNAKTGAALSTRTW